MFRKLQYILFAGLAGIGIWGIVHAANWPTTVSSDSNLYIASNNCGTTLSSAVTSGATTINVGDTACFPTVGFVTINNEAIKYTGKTSTTFTGCTRGADGTTAASHIIGSVAMHSVIAAHHNVLKDELIAISTSFLQGAQFHTDYTNTRFGIGTASPGQRLQINIPGSDDGILITDGGSNYNSIFQMSRNGSVKLKMTTGSNIGNVFGSGGLYLGGALDTPHLQIESSGQVGIGGTPAGNFDVVNTGSVVGTIKTTSTGGTRSAILRLNEANTGANDGTGQILFTYDTDYKQSAAIKGILTSGGAAGILKFYTGTTERASIDESGVVSISDNSAKLKLIRPANSRAGYVMVTNTSGGLRYHGATNGAGETSVAAHTFTGDSPSADTTYMTILGDGKVGIGTTPGATLHVLSNTGDVDSGIRVERTAATTGRYNLIVGSSGQLIIGEVDGGTKRITLGKTTGYLTVPGVYDQTTASAANVVVDSSGNLMRSTSARKYKKNITNITLDEAKKTLQVTPVKYQSKAPIDDPAEWHYGFVADDAGSIDPLLVTYDVKTSTTGVKNKIPENIQYERIVVPLLKLVQDLETRVATLEAKVDTLEKAGK